MTVSDITRIAIDVARSQSPDLRVAGVTLAGEGNYTEVIVDIAGCRAEPCRLSVGVFRDASEDTVRREIAQQLERHVREHRDAS
jgi:hypothetical protein